MSQPGVVRGLAQPVRDVLVANIRGKPSSSLPGVEGGEVAYLLSCCDLGTPSGLTPYKPAWDLQRSLLAQRIAWQKQGW
jgi:hypothetical protein